MWQSMLVKLVLELLKPFLSKILDLAWEKTEEWANGLGEKGAQKPSGEKKQEVAAMEVVRQVPGMDLETAKVLMQAMHRKKVGKINKVGKARG